MSKGNSFDKLTLSSFPIASISLEFMRQAAVAVLYLSLGSIIHVYFTSNGIVSAIWPGSGFALAALLIGGRRYIWGVLFGSLLLNTLFLDSLWAIGGMTLAQTLEAFIGAWLLTRNDQPILFVNTLKNHLRVILFGAGVACFVGAIIGPFALVLADIISSDDYFKNVLHWWMGDALGVILVAPFILAFGQKTPPQFNVKQLLEATLLLTLTFVAGQIIFLDWFHETIIDSSKAYVMFLFVAWISIRFGIYGATFALLIIASQALWGAKLGVGFFANEIVTANLTNYWFYMMILSQVGMTLGIYVNTIKQANKVIGVAKQRFSDLVNSTDGIVWEADVATFNFTFVSEQAERLLGYPAKDWMKPGFWVEHIHPDDQRWAPEFCLEATRRLEPHTFEYRFLTCDGRIVWLRDIVSVVSENGEPRWLRGIMIDITEQKNAEQDLRIAATAFETQEGIIVTDNNKIILRVNHAFTEITGYTAKDVIGKTPKILSSGLQDEDFYIAMWDAINHTEKWKGEIYNRRKNGEIYPQHLTITSVRDQSGTVANYVATLNDISVRKEAEEEIKQLAFYDFLTGLPNRRLLLDRLNQALASSARSKHNGALLFIDLDNFKILNDTLGHDFGDQLLIQASERLKSCIRECDAVSRIGGDEFVVLLEELSKDPIKSLTQTERIANKIQTVLGQPYQLKMHQYHSSSSIGVTIFDDHRQTMEELLKQADIAMYQAKKSGRNAVCFFDPKMQELIVARSSLEAELRKSLDRQQFQLYYQIQVNHLNRPIGVEALLRWKHEEYGLVSPAEFIPLAEETNLIIPIGEWVLETACAQIKAWQSNALTRDLTLSVNVSAKQFLQPSFVSQVQAFMQRFEIKPRLLKLELTESMLLVDVEEIIPIMNQLRDVGVTFSLDDFGTGYSSLQYLKQLPLDQLKIDQSFVRDITFDQSDKSIVRTIIAMARGLNLDVIAEGVETEEQKQLLLAKGCYAYQGYLFSKPMELEKIDELLKKMLM